MASAISATYRIGPSDFFTPGDLAADAKTVDDQVGELDRQIEGNDQVDQTLVDQWTVFHQEWTAFYAAQFGGFFTNLFTALNDSNRDQLIQEETKLAAFAAQFQAAGVAQLAAGVVQPSTGSGDTLGKQAANQLDTGGSGLASKTLWIVGGLIALVLVWRLVK